MINMASKTAFLFFSLFACLSCAAPPIKGVTPPAPRYTLPNGRPISENDFPEVGLLRAENYRCTVFTISDDVAVSAAHCVPEHATEVSLDFNFGTLTSKEWIVLGDTDIALFHIQSEGPVKALPHMDLATDFSAIIGPLSFVGYGCSPITLYPTSAPIILPRGTKRMVDFYPGEVHFWTARIPGSRPRSYFTDSDLTFCGGDSGGPIFKHGTKEVIGVASASLNTTDDGIVFYSGSIFEETISFARKLKGLPEPTLEEEAAEMLKLLLGAFGGMEESK